MSSVVISGDTSGSVTLQAPSVSGSTVITLPSTSGTLASIASVNNNGVVYANSSGQPTTTSTFVFDGTNVGIGTASPGAKLDVRGGIATGYSSGQGVYYYNSDGTNSYEIYNAGATGAGNPVLSFYQIGTGERMRIDSSGRTLIGLSSSITSWGSGQGQQLQVTASGSRYPGISSYAFSNTAAGDAAMINLGRSRSATVGTLTATQSGDALGYLIFEGVNSSGSLAGGGWISTIQTAAAGATYLSTAMAFNTSDATTGVAERMRIASDGTIGVGTSSPTAISSTYGTIDIRGSSGGGLNFGTTGSNTSSVYGNSGGLTLVAYGATVIVFYTNGTSRMQIDSSGGVTITNLAGSGSRTVTASAAGLLSAASDSSLKQEVTDAHIAGLAEIMQVQPKAYKWLDDIAARGDDAAVELGFFADQVAPLIPSAAPKGDDGLYGFYDRSMLATLVKAVQELKGLVDTQANTIQTLTERITSLEGK